MWYTEICIAYRNLCVCMGYQPAIQLHIYIQLYADTNSVHTEGPDTTQKLCVIEPYHKDSRSQAKIPFHTKCLHTKALYQLNNLKKAS